MSESTAQTTATTVFPPVPVPTGYLGGLTPEAFEALPAVLRRFLAYTQFETASDMHAAPGVRPSTAAQTVLARRIAGELAEMGLSPVLDASGLRVHIPATPGFEDRPTAGFIAHLDTSPEASGGPVKWKIVDYEGGPLTLNAESGVVLDPTRFPEVAAAAGGPLVVTDGTTLLGADDKAGAAILTELARVLVDGTVPHARIALAWTYDEEIGRGTEGFDLKAFGADYAYTIDGGTLGGFETETFNASQARVVFRGLSVHPGSAKNRMVNALRMATDFMNRLPPGEVPEKTEGREGFFHPVEMKGSVTEAEVTLIIRDHDEALFRAREAKVREIVEAMRGVWGDRIEVEIDFQYHNMGHYMAKAGGVAEMARSAYRECGVEPVEEPIRGGTDGSRLSEMGLPTPNIFTGGLNFHGVHECLPVRHFLKAFEIVCAIAGKTTQLRTLEAFEG